MQADGAGVAAIADDGHHLADADGLAGRDDPRQHRTADPAPLSVRRHIDAVLHRVAIGRPQAEGSGIGEAERLPLIFRQQVGQAAGDDGLAALVQLVARGRDLLEGAEAVQDVVAIDLGQGGHVGGFSRAHDHLVQSLSMAQTAKA